jgi:uncharacterized protein YecT (DUF1311 family)
MNRELNKKIASGGRLLIFAAMAFGLVSALSIFRGQASGVVKEKNAQTQMQLNKEACDDYKKADVEMNGAYQTILREYRGEPAFVAALRKAQLAWIRYRDAHVESIYPGEASQYGSVNPMCRCTQLATITRERTKILNQWVEGVEEGDVCAGSVKIK